MKDSLIRKLCAWMLVAGACAWAGTYLTACNTMEGAGEDIQDVGEEIEDAAD